MVFDVQLCNGNKLNCLCGTILLDGCCKRLPSQYLEKFVAAKKMNFHSCGVSIGNLSVSNPPRVN